MRIDQREVVLSTLIPHVGTAQKVSESIAVTVQEGKEGGASSSEVSLGKVRVEKNE